MMNKKIMHNLSRSIPDFVETEVEACCNKLMQDMVVRVATEVDSAYAEVHSLWIAQTS